MITRLLTVAIFLIYLLAAGCGDGEGGAGVDADSIARYEQSRFGFFRGGGSYGFMEELEVHWQRPHPGPFVWGTVEREEGSYDWSETDLFVREAQESDVLLLATIWPYADWDQQRCREKLPGAPFGFMPTLGDYRSTPCDLDAYGEFTRAMVERYDGDGRDDMPGLVLPLRYWEVINEPDLQTGVPFFAGDPLGEDYREMLLLTGAAIRDADPEAMVLNGGIAGLGGRQSEFWKTVFSGEGSEMVDVITLHAVIETSANNLVLLRGLREDLGLAQPVWVTEIRTARREESAGHGESSDEGAPTFTPEEVAEQERLSAGLVREFVAAFGEGADKLFYMGLDNATPTAEAARLVNCGVVIGGELEEDRLILDDCVEQQPFFAFRTMVSMLDYFESVEKLAEGQYRFLVDGRPVYVLWGDGALPEMIAGTVVVTDIYGQAMETDASLVKLSDVPLYLEESPLDAMG